MMIKMIISVICCFLVLLYFIIRNHFNIRYEYQMLLDIMSCFVNTTRTIIVLVFLFIVKIKGSR